MNLMRSKIVSATIVILLGLLIVPVIVTQLIPTDQRDYEVLRLEDTIYTEISFFNATQDINLELSSKKQCHSSNQ